VSAAIRFSELPWESVGPNARQKSFVADNQAVRLLELSTGFEEAAWCFKTHVGYVLTGEFRLAFADHTEVLCAGDGLNLIGGELQKHRAAVIDGPVTLFLVEPVAG
jgi:hypothetical protein